MIRALVAALALWASPAVAGPRGAWDSQVAEASARFGIPAEWIRRVIAAESGGRLRFGGRPIVSRAGAMGLMQLMPETWSAMRARYGLGGDPHDPRDNILAGTAYLRLMYDRFGYPGLFAAYNAGPARYAGHLAGRARLPAETVAYLAAVTGRRAPPDPVSPAYPGGRAARSAEAPGSVFVVRREGTGAPVPPAGGDPADRLFVVRRSGGGVR